MISLKDELQQFTSKIEIKGRLETRDGNYRIYFNEFEDAEYEFLVKNKYAILEFLKGLECVNSSRTYMEDLMYCGDDGKCIKMKIPTSISRSTKIIVQTFQKKIFNKGVKI